MAKLTLLFKGRTLAIHHLRDTVTLIGRAPDCDLRIDSLAVAPIHAEIVCADDGCHLLSLHDESPVSINDNPVLEHDLRHGDMVGIGKHALRFSQDDFDFQLRPSSTRTAPTPQGVSPRTADPQAAVSEKGLTGFLQILNGPHLGRLIPLDRPLIRLGQAGAERAIVVYHDAGYYLSHLEGHSPATINGIPIGDQRIRMQSGNVIQIGDTRMKFFL